MIVSSPHRFSNQLILRERRERMKGGKERPGNGHGEKKTNSSAGNNLHNESDSDDDLFNTEINDINELSDTSNPPAVSE